MNPRRGWENAEHCVRLRARAKQLAQSNPKEALAVARSIPLAWYRSQAIAAAAEHVAEPMHAAALLRAAAAEAARDADPYRAIAVQAWPIAVAGRRRLLVVGVEIVARLTPLLPAIAPLLSRRAALVKLWDASVPLGRPTYRPLALTLAETSWALLDSSFKRLRKRGKSSLAQLNYILYDFDPGLAEEILESTPNRSRAAHIRARIDEGKREPLFFHGWDRPE